MDKRGIGIFMFLLWIALFSAIKKDKQQVYLEIIDKPIVVGENTRLFCNLSLVPDCCSNTMTWMRNQFVIVHHGASVDASKYAQIQTQKGFLLQIKPFEEKDMYAKYSCLYGFQAAIIDFATDENKYEKHPSSDNIKINEYVDEKNDVLVIDVAFKAVLPMPKCILLSDGRDLKAHQMIKQHSNDLFYNVSIQMTLNNTVDDCSNNTTLKCSIGGYTMSHTLKHNIPCFVIPEVKLDNKKDGNVMLIIIPLLIGIFFVVFVSLMYLSRKRLQQVEKPEEIISLDMPARGTCSGKEKLFRQILKMSNSTENEIRRTNNDIHKRRIYFHETGKHNDERRIPFQPIDTCKTNRGERLESIQLLGTHKQGEISESIPPLETQEQDEISKSIPLLETQEQGTCSGKEKLFRRRLKMSSSTEDEIRRTNNDDLHKRRMYFHETGKH